MPKLQDDVWYRGVPRITKALGTILDPPPKDTQTYYWINKGIIRAKKFAGEYIAQGASLREDVARIVQPK